MNLIALCHIDRRLHWRRTLARWSVLRPLKNGSFINGSHPMLVFSQLLRCCRWVGSGNGINKWRHIWVKNRSNDINIMTTWRAPLFKERWRASIFRFFEQAILFIKVTQPRTHIEHITIDIHVAFSTYSHQHIPRDCVSTNRAMYIEFRTQVAWYYRTTTLVDKKNRVEIWIMWIFYISITFPSFRNELFLYVRALHG